MEQPCWRNRNDALLSNASALLMHPVHMSYSSPPPKK